MPSTAASVETAMEMRAVGSPGALASTTMGCNSSSSSASAGAGALVLPPWLPRIDIRASTCVPAPVRMALFVPAAIGPPTSMRASAARSACGRAATEVTRTTARTRPWYAAWDGASLRARACASPLCVPCTRPGPETTRKVTVSVAITTRRPLASRTVARTSAASWPSSSSLLPVPVLSFGASTVNCSEAFWLLVWRTVVATTAPDASVATAVRVPASKGTSRHSA